ncbi:D-glycero-beta-D-manno-heptose 1-phosphate adenylyltransferase [Flaviflexus huanghaiensis]|uniref:D-glycero-beta-D-manno-heptose 1-phosphate adenylyltransferase n=1 Tax=Flaviflexus huanghaiensis TaxID=1111473 RepID=UPI0015F79832|nr:D-glycero-beta-D-manno-heptose 1-phosphate adenylyltransferase [Flaviflexus huanghaiensis]
MTASEKQTARSLSGRQSLSPDLPLIIADQAPTITVIGDAILDVWVYGSSRRLAREAPAPVIDQSRRTLMPGGAANTAMNLASLGARVRIVSVVGKDREGETLTRLLEAEGVDTRLLLVRADVQTTSKTRIVAGDQIICRLDRAARDHGEEAVTAFVEQALASLEGSDAVVICDYDSPLSSALPDSLAAVDRPLTIVDSHEPERWARIRPDISTPNAVETEKTLGRRLGDGPDRVATVAASAAELTRALGTATPIVTLDRDGAVLLDESGIVHRSWARPATERQASGAGDTFVAGLTVARAAGLPLTTALDFAQAAADVVVHRPGTALCRVEDLVAHLGAFDAPLSQDELLAKVGADRRAGRRIVMTNGCFDVLHRGHTYSLNKAKQLGDVLVVALNDDDSVRRLKGPERPINTLVDRAGVVAALSCVDYVTYFSTDTPIPLIERLQPDIYVKGGDYTPEMLKETDVVKRYGGQVKILDYVPDYSTTLVVERMKSRSADSAMSPSPAPAGEES